LVNAGAKYGILVVKRPRYGDPADSYAVLPLSDLVELLKEAGY